MQLADLNKSPIVKPVTTYSNHIERNKVADTLSVEHRKN